MKRFAALAAAVVAIAAAAPAWAAKTFVLDNVTLQGGGTLTGSFTTNDALTSLEAIDITASMNTVGAYTFQAFHYNDLSLVYSDHMPSYFSVKTVGYAQELQLYFGALTDSGATLLPNHSFEHQVVAGTRMVTGGGVVAAPISAVPEPATWAMMIVGFGLAGSALRLGGRKGVRAAA
jgi:hypothetical protein